MAILSIAVACFSERGTPNSNAAAPRATGSILDPEPVLQLGGTGVDGRSLVLDVTAAIRVGDLVVVADRLSPAVHYFDLTGRHVRSVGREGEGPGEFRLLRDVERCAGDSVFVWDARLFRMTVLDPTGAVARSYQTPVMTATIECSASGVVVAQLHSSESFSPRGDPTTQYSDLLLLSPAGDTLGVLDSIRLGEGRPLGAMTDLALSSDRLYVGSGDSSYVDVYGLDGTPHGRLRTGVPRRPATRAQQEAFVDHMLSSMYRDDTATRNRVRKQFLEMPIPEYLPAYRHIFASPGGTLWVQLSLMVDTTLRLRAIATDGTILGDVELHGAVQPLSVDDEYLFVRYEDPLGEPRVAGYRVRTPSSTPSRREGTGASRP